VTDKLEKLNANARNARIAALTTRRPIEEAPKDGTWVLGWWRSGYDWAVPEVVRWSDTHRAWCREREDFGLAIAPTHFLPLPVSQ
jgi:hypothetical protein